MDCLIFFIELALAIIAMAWARWRIDQIIIALITTVLFWACVGPFWQEPHTGILRTDPSLFFMPWVALPAIFLILFSGHNFFQRKRFAWAITGFIALALLGTLVAIGYVNLNRN